MTNSFLILSHHPPHSDGLYSQTLGQNKHFLKNGNKGRKKHRKLVPRSVTMVNWTLRFVAFWHDSWKDMKVWHCGLEKLENCSKQGLLGHFVEI